MILLNAWQGAGRDTHSMLRGQAEPELVATLEYQAEGTIEVDGQPCILTKYRISANYRIPGKFQK